MVRPGDFLVVNRCGDRRHAAFGAVLALAAQKAGAVGVAIDGYACDLPEIREMGMPLWCLGASVVTRSEEHTSELQSLMRISYAVFCLNKKNKKTQQSNQ